jgi:hypothetical protein
MKLKNILANRLNNKFKRSNYFRRPKIQTQVAYDQDRGIDSGSATSGGSMMTTGIPIKPEHRKFLGYGEEEYDRNL